MVISRDVNLDESVFGFLSTSLDEDIDELNFLDLISIPILLQIRSTSRQKSEKVAQVKIKTYQENHAPFDTKWFLKKQVRRLTRMTDDEKMIIQMTNLLLFYFSVQVLMPLKDQPS